MALSDDDIQRILAAQKREERKQARVDAVFDVAGALSDRRKEKKAQRRATEAAASNAKQAAKHAGDVRAQAERDRQSADDKAALEWMLHSDDPDAVAARSAPGAIKLSDPRHEHWVATSADPVAKAIRNAEIEANPEGWIQWMWMNYSDDPEAQEAKRLWDADGPARAAAQQAQEAEERRQRRPFRRAVWSAVLLLLVLAFLLLR